MQIDASLAVRNRAKSVAYSKGLSLTEFVLTAMGKMGDDELSKLVKKELADKLPPGRPQK